MYTAQACDLKAEHMMKVYSDCYSSNVSDCAAPKGKPSQIIQLTVLFVQAYVMSGHSTLVHNFEV